MGLCVLYKKYYIFDIDFGLNMSYSDDNKSKCDANVFWSLTVGYCHSLSMLCFDVCRL